MDPNSSINRLNAAAEGAGAEPRAVKGLEMLDEISQAVAPMRLPDELVRFWTEIGDRAVHSWPEFCGPAFSLESWNRDREEQFRMAPANLLLIAYSSWNCMSIELDSSDVTGGAIFQWALDGEDFVLRHHRLTDWLDRLATLIEGGSYKVGKYEDEPAVVTVDDDEAEMQPGREATPTPHPTYGSTIVFDREPEKWPVHWQRLSGMEAEDLIAHGATHTIAAILDAADKQPVHGTIQGLVRGIYAQKDAKARVEDETGTIDVLCPAATTALGPILGQRYEFDVVVIPSEEAPAAEAQPTEESESESDVDRLTRALGEKNPLGPARAIASAVRRCEPPT